MTAYSTENLKKNIQIITLSSHVLTEYPFFLPKGFLRDSIKRLKVAHLIVVLIDGGKDITKLIRKYSRAPILFCKKKYTNLLFMNGEKKDLKKKMKCVAFSAIAHNCQFIECS